MSYLIGHLVGDYLLQSSWMVKHKKQKTFIGCMACLIHSTLWALAVMVFTQWFSWYIFIALIVQHFVVNRGPLIVWFKDMKDGAMPQNGLYISLIIIQDNIVHLALLFLMDKYVVSYFL